MIGLYEQQIRSINVNDLKNRMKQKDRPLMILDARDIETFYKGHIPGACSVFDPEIMSLAKNFDKNLSICVYGPGQATPSPSMVDRLAGDAAKKITDMGFKSVCVLSGGFEAWDNAGNRVDMSKRKLT